MAICRSGAYLRRSHGLVVREAVSRADALGFRQARRKSGYPITLPRLGTSVRLCLYASLPGTVSNYTGALRGERRGFKVKCLPAWRPGGKAAPHAGRRLVLAISAFPETRAVVSLRRLATHYQVCDGPPEGPRALLHLISIRLNHWSRLLNLDGRASGPLLPPPAC